MITKTNLYGIMRPWIVFMIFLFTTLGVELLRSVRAEVDDRETSLYPYQESIDYDKDEVITEADLARASQNPIADLVSLPLQSNFSFLENSGNLVYNLNLQPVIPVSLNQDWNLVTRTIFPVFALENSPPGFDRIGLGDINTSLFFSPVDSGDLNLGLWSCPIISYCYSREFWLRQMDCGS